MTERGRHRNYTDRKLLVRLSLTLAFIFGISGAVVYYFSMMLIERFNETEREMLFSAIESGPLQLARLNSADLATIYLDRLASEANQNNPSIVGSRILSGPAGDDVYAAWEIPAIIPPHCLAAFEREVTFPDAIYPYRVLLKVDHCVSRQALNVIKLLCITIGLVLVATTIGAGAWAAYPLFASLRRVSAMQERRSDDMNDGSELAAIEYAPLRDLAEKVLENRRLVQQAAVARTIQMLAHDVRKPFSMLSIGLDRLSRVTSDPVQMSQVIAKVKAHVGAARKRVEGMLVDILAMDARSEAIMPGLTRIEDLIETALCDAFGDQRSASVHFEYDILDCPPLMVDAGKVQRIFTNIVDNARQAMKGVGTLSFRARPQSSGRRHEVEVTIHNTGSYVAAEDRESMFEAFFTKGKVGGTGLGLAVARKVVVAHGGVIRCESNRESGTTFIFTLPSAQGGAIQASVSGLPSNSKALIEAMEQALS